MNSVARDGSVSEPGAKRPRVGLRIAVVVPLIGLSLGVGVLLGIALSGPHQYGIGAYIRDFGKSAGFAGIAAVIAATIASIGISRQVDVSRLSLEAERDRADATSWWRNFEWISDRGVPGDPTHTPMPLDVSIGMMTALQARATNEVQQAACAGLLDLLAHRLSEQDEQTAETLPAAETIPVVPRTGRLLFGSSDRSVRAMDALEDYVSVTKGRPSARSGVAEAVVYERQVLEAIDRLSGLTLRRRDTRPARGGAAEFEPDATVNVNGRTVLVEIKALRHPENSCEAHQLNQLLDNLRMRLIDGMPVVFVSKLDSNYLRDAANTKGVHFVRWASGEDDEALKAALMEAAQNASSRREARSDSTQPF